MKTLFNKIVKMNTVVFYCVLLFINIVWGVSILKIYNICGVVEFSQNTVSNPDIYDLFFLPVCVLIEEIGFRWMPMVLFLSLRKNTLKIEKYEILVIVIISSIIFGYLHGNKYNILIQGVGGLALFLVFLRSLYKERMKNVEKSKDLFKPLLSSTTFHLLFNISCIILDYWWNNKAPRFFVGLY